MHFGKWSYNFRDCPFFRLTVTRFFLPETLVCLKVTVDTVCDTLEHVERLENVRKLKARKLRKSLRREYLNNNSSTLPKNMKKKIN